MIFLSLLFLSLLTLEEVLSLKFSLLFPESPFPLVSVLLILVLFLWLILLSFPSLQPLPPISLVMESLAWVLKHLQHLLHNLFD